MDATQLASFATVRAATYAAFEHRRDALFELCATLVTTGPVPTLPLLSVQPQHHRRWGSLYDDLAVGEMRCRPLEQLLADHPLGGGEPVYTVDVSVWPRRNAEISPVRVIYYHASHNLAAYWGARAWSTRISLARSII